MWLWLLLGYGCMPMPCRLTPPAMEMGDGLEPLPVIGGGDVMSMSRPKSSGMKARRYLWQVRAVERAAGSR